MEARVGCSIKDLFCLQFGISPDYFDERIQTIFLDGNPVDDADTAMVREGSHIALSAAMPGLVGAVLRKGGFYSPMRREISYREEGMSGSLEQGLVNIKLFNLLLKDLGPAFLERGIGIKGNDLEDFFKRQAGDFWMGLREASMDGKGIDRDGLLKMRFPNMIILLKVRPLTHLL